MRELRREALNKLRSEEGGEGSGTYNYGGGWQEGTAGAKGMWG